MATIAMRDYLRRQHLELPAILALAVGGGAIGLGIVSVGGWGPSKLTHLAEFRLWLFLIAAQTSLWAIGAAVFLAPQLRLPVAGLSATARVPVVASVAATAAPLVAFFVYAKYTLDLHYPLPYHEWKILALSLIGMGVALLGVAQLALVKAALENEPASGTLADVERYLGLRTLLERVLAVEGAILGAAILSAGGLRNTVVAFHSHDQSSFPRDYVLVYGAYFTLLLALLYAPVYLRLLEVGRANVDAACKPEEPASPNWLPAYQKRKKLEEHLQLQLTTGASFRAGVAILAPLGSALVGLLIGAA
jgi:hypothetical protein